MAHDFEGGRLLGIVFRIELQMQDGGAPYYHLGPPSTEQWRHWPNESLFCIPYEFTAYRYPVYPIRSPALRDRLLSADAQGPDPELESLLRDCGRGGSLLITRLPLTEDEMREIGGALPELMEELRERKAEKEKAMAPSG